MIWTNCIFALLIVLATIVLTEANSIHGPEEEDPSLPMYHAMAVDSLNQYEEQNELSNHHVVLEVIKVTKQVVAGYLTTIDFYAARTLCKSVLYDLVPPDCPLDTVSPTLLCQSQLWSRRWLNKREITIKCNNAST